MQIARTDSISDSALPSSDTKPGFGGMERRHCLLYCLVLAVVPLVCAVCWLGLAQLQFGVRTPSSRMVGVGVSTKMALAASMPSPKLIVLGGSSVHAGVRAAMIQHELGIPTLNLGTGMPLRLDYMLTLGRRAARPGDTVLLCIEYELYRATPVSDVLLDYALARDPAYIREKPFPAQLALLFAVPPVRMITGLRQRRHPTPDAAVHTYMNGNGDFTDNPAYRRDMTRIRSGAPDSIEELPENSVGMQRIPEFVRWCNAHSVHVLATFPSTLHFEAYDTPKAQRFFNQIRDLYAGVSVPVLGNPKEFMVDESQLFDTYYHLNDQGAAIRTQQTIAELRPYFPAVTPGRQ